MKKKKSYLGILLVPFISTSAFSLTCSINPVNTEQKASDCAYEFLRNGHSLYEFCETKGHVGDINKCTAESYLTKSSYFTGNVYDFLVHVSQPATVSHCKTSNQSPNQYVCWIHTTQGCYIADGKNGKIVDEAQIRIRKDTGELITFYPIE